MRFFKAAMRAAAAHNSPPPLKTDEYKSSANHYKCGHALHELADSRPGHQRRRVMLADKRALEAAAGRVVDAVGGGVGGRGARSKGCCIVIRGLRYCSNAGCHEYVDRDVNGALNILRKGLESRRLADGSCVGGPPHLERKTEGFSVTNKGKRVLIGSPKPWTGVPFPKA